MNNQIEKTATIQDGINYVNEHLQDGVICPCCQRYAKRYRRQLTSAMAYSLILICKKTWMGKFAHIEDYFKDLSIPSSIRGDFPKLRFFDLIEKKPGNREDGSPRNGYYKITQKGKDFIYGYVKVPKHVFIYNNKVNKFSEDKVNIAEALTNKFDYKEIMRGFVDDKGQLKLY